MGRSKYQSPMEWWIKVRAMDTTPRSDFKHGEEPKHTGYKRNYRKGKYRPTAKGDKFWCEHYEHRPKCWKDQSKRRHQYRPIAAA